MMTTEAPLELRAPRIRPYFGRLWHEWHNKRDLGRIRAMVPRILPEVSPIPAAPHPASWIILAAQWTQTGLAVIWLGTPSEPPKAILKAAFSRAGAQGLQTQASVLTQLHGDTRLGEWRRLLPTTLAQGEIAGLHYSLQQCLLGSEPEGWAADPHLRVHLLSKTAAAIRPLHEATLELTFAGEALLTHAIERPIDLILRTVPSGRRVQRKAALGRLAAELRGLLAEELVGTSWIHGDYWLGNVLMQSSRHRITGIVDWSAAAPNEPVFHDVLHLILQAKQVVEHCELGDVVRAMLTGARWTQPELELLEAEVVGLPLNKHSLRGMVLLYWLRRLQCIFEQDLAHAQNKLWVAWNVDRVLQCL